MPHLGNRCAVRAEDPCLLVLPSTFANVTLGTAPEDCQFLYLASHTSWSAFSAFGLLLHWLHSSIRKRRIGQRSQLCLVQMKREHAKTAPSDEGRDKNPEGGTERVEPGALLELLRLLTREPPQDHDFKTCPICKRYGITKL